MTTTDQIKEQPKEAYVPEIRRVYLAMRCTPTQVFVFLAHAHTTEGYVRLCQACDVMFEISSAYFNIVKNRYLSDTHSPHMLALVDADQYGASHFPDFDDQFYVNAKAQLVDLETYLSSLIPADAPRKALL